MATAALSPYHDGPRTHFVANVDGAHLADTISGLDPARTLIIVASKTFVTTETMTNAASARRWIAEALGESAVAAHFVAVSTALAKVAAFGIAEDRVFGFWDWVGGRYSVWSAIGLPVMIAIGETHFRDFLSGAHAMDQHFRTAPLAENLPVLLALVGIWHRDICLYPARAILPYDQRLARFPAYLQQLEMESNGKSTRLAGDQVTHQTCPVVFGEPGTDAQHSFMQLVHQGTGVIPVDFLIAAESGQLGTAFDRPAAHRLLAANAFAQAEALLAGKDRDTVEAEMRAAGASVAEIASVAPARVFAGNRPSNTLLFRRLDGFTLGRLIALYEHKVAVQGWLWGIDSFDQWGVELGKTLARAILPELAPGAPAGTHDGSTSGLIARFRALRGEP